jgi:hypothetical protein
MKSSITSVPSIHVSIASWEYGCCGTVPAEGVALHVALTAYPADPRDSHAASQVLDWDPNMEIVRFGACSAHWDGQHGDPRTQPIRLFASWHEHNPMVPTIDGRIVTVFNETALFRLVNRSWTYVPGTTTRISTPAVERFPTDEVVRAELQEGAIVRFTRGAAVELTVENSVEPTTDDLVAHRIRVERESRTVHLTGPASVFGPTVPGRGDQVSVDLSDVRLQKRGKAAELTHAVRGTAEQVSAALPFGENSTVYGGVRPGTPAHEITSPIFMVLVIDPDDM